MNVVLLAAPADENERLALLTHLQVTHLQLHQTRRLVGGG